MLRRTIRRNVTVSSESRGAGDVHNASPSGVQHGGQDLVYAVKDAVEIDFHHAAPEFDISFQEWRRASLAGVVHQDVNRTEAGAGSVKSLAQRRRFADVGLNVVKIRTPGHIALARSAAAEHADARDMRCKFACDRSVIPARAACGPSVA